MNTLQQELAAFFGLLNPEYRKGFERRMRDGQRLGQAFFNSVPISMQRELQTSGKDPFHRVHPDHVRQAIDHLTTK